MWFFLSLTLDEWLFAIGGLIFILMSNLLVKALAPKSSGALGFITTILTAVPLTVIHLTQKIVATFAPATVGPQRRVAAGLHDAARLTDDTADVIRTQGAIIAGLAGAISGTATSAEVAGAISGLTKRVGNAEAQAKGIGADVLPRLKHLEKQISSDVLPKIRSLDKEINKDIAREKARARGVEKGLAGDIGKLWDWTRTHPWTVVTDAFVGAVAVAISRLGLDWIKCNSARNFFNRRGCNAWNDLDSLLAAALAVAASMSLVELAKAEQEVIGDLTTVVKDFWQV